MAESKNLMGLNLNVDSELMAEAAKEAIIAGEKTVPTSVDDCPAFTLDD